MNHFIIAFLFSSLFFFLMTCIIFPSGLVYRSICPFCVYVKTENMLFLFFLFLIPYSLPVLSSIREKYIYF